MHGREEGGISVPPSGVHVSHCIQQHSRDGGIAVSGRGEQRRLAVLIRMIWIGAGLKQRGHNLRIVPAGRPDQGRGPVCPRGIHIRAPAQQRQHGLLIACLDRIEKLRIGEQKQSNWQCPEHVLMI